MRVKRVLLVGFLLGFIYSNSSGQKNLDIGLFGGTSYYLGDLNNSRQFNNLHFAYGGLIRFNYGSRWAGRLSIFNGGISADDLDFNYKYQRIRKRAFYSPITEVTGQIELNFKPYRVDDKRNKYTPYVHLGGTFLIASFAIQPFQPAIPFGIGFKFNLLPRVGMGFEWTFRKTFTDGLDKVTWEKGLPTSAGDKDYTMLKQTGYYHQRDWYSFAGIFITYKIKTGGLDCNIYR